LAARHVSCEAGRNPAAKFIWPHRDPTRASASSVSIIGAIQWSRSDRPFNEVSPES
jgi:hypothetical protein